jgi:RNA-directed DNA polymerase
LLEKYATSTRKDIGISTEEKHIGLMRRGLKQTLIEGVKKMSGNMLMKKVCEMETLMNAWRKVRSNKGVPGVDFVTIQQFESSLMENLQQLSTQLSYDRYYPMPIKRIAIKKASGGVRELGILTIQDRIAQRAVLDVIEPIYERIFLPCSYGFRPNRSVMDAIQKVLEYKDLGYDWIVDADVKSFFDTIDHSLMMQFVKREIDEAPILRLIQMWLDVGVLRQPNPVADSLGMLMENTKRYLSDTVERTINHLLHRDSLFSYPALPVADGDDDIGYLVTHPYPSKEGTAEELRSQAKREAIVRLGRDGILFLLSCSSSVRKLLKAKNLLIASPFILAALAFPAAGKAIQKRRHRPIGTIQGGPLSPLLANIYLHQFDKSMVSQGFCLVRYGDDFLILCKSEGRAHHALESARRKLLELRLTLHPEKTRIITFNDEIKFLGYIFDSEGCYEQKKNESLQSLLCDTVRTGAEITASKGRFILEKGKEVRSIVSARWRNIRRLKSPQEDNCQCPETETE